MAAPNAQIRPYKLKDEKVVKFAIGKALMEGLTIANRRAVFHPFTLTMWVALSCIMIQYFSWWPNPEHGFLRFFSAVPAFACWAVPILAWIDWINRPYFEDATSDALHNLDVANIEEYYALSPSSGFFVLEYDGSIIGLVAIDASKNSQSNQSFKEHNKVKEQKRGTSSVAVIRHFYVEELFRKSNVQDDLVAFAVRHAFNSSGDVKEIRVVTSSLLGYVQESFGKLGFRIEGITTMKGVYSWTARTMNLRKTDWTKDKQMST
ncbi:hypothetical protein EDD17DRAFT_1729142 [Pisolithus thermaeus]|nr:hypothetical protein EDD17DRAFT_1729142 [Pisolithus thermaeus]